jgi:hypothetical protein
MRSAEHAIGDGTPGFEDEDEDENERNPLTTCLRSAGATLRRGKLTTDN